MDRQLPGSAVHHHLCVGWAELMTSLSRGRTMMSYKNVFFFSKILHIFSAKLGSIVWRRPSPDEKIWKIDEKNCARCAKMTEKFSKTPRFSSNFCMIPHSSFENPPVLTYPRLSSRGHIMEHRYRFGRRSPGLPSPSLHTPVCCWSV